MEKHERNSWKFSLPNSYWVWVLSRWSSKCYQLRGEDKWNRIEYELNVHYYYHMCHTISIAPWKWPHRNISVWKNLQDLIHLVRYINTIASVYPYSVHIAVRVKGNKLKDLKCRFSPHSLGWVCQPNEDAQHLCFFGSAFTCPYINTQSGNASLLQFILHNFQVRGRSNNGQFIFLRLLSRQDILSCFFPCTSSLNLWTILSKFQTVKYISC